MRCILRAMLVGAFAGTIASVLAATTAENLKLAYKGETTAVAKYTAYAAKADKEGYKSIGALFRAAAGAEKIHAQNHKEALAKLGVTPTAGRFTGPVGKTQANLKDAIKGETLERDITYPAMLAQAKVEKNHEAVRTIVYAMNAEGSHAQLYKEALKQAEQGKKSGVESYSVCPMCGETFGGKPPLACPVCATPSDSFVRFGRDKD